MKSKGLLGSVYGPRRVVDPDEVGAELPKGGRRQIPAQQNERGGSGSTRTHVLGGWCLEHDQRSELETIPSGTDHIARLMYAIEADGIWQ